MLGATSDGTMEKPQLIIEAFKLLHDWSKWLIALEAAICASLWPKLTGTPKPSIFLYLGWMMFLGSIVTATILIVAIPFYVRRLDESGIEDLRKVRVFVGVEYAFFLVGLGCFTCRMVEVWLASTPD